MTDELNITAFNQAHQNEKRAHALGVKPPIKSHSVFVDVPMRKVNSFAQTASDQYIREEEISVHKTPQEEETTLLEDAASIGTDIGKGVASGTMLFASDLMKTGHAFTGVDHLDTWSQFLIDKLPNDYENPIIGTISEEIMRVAPYAAGGAWIAGSRFAGLLAAELLAGGVAGFMRNPEHENSLDGVLDLVNALGLDTDSIDEYREYFSTAIDENETGPQFARRLENAGVDSTIAGTLVGIFGLARSTFSNVSSRGTSPIDGHATDVAPVDLQQFPSLYRGATDLTDFANQTVDSFAKYVELSTKKSRLEYDITQGERNSYDLTAEWAADWDIDLLSDNIIKKSQPGEPLTVIPFSQALEMGLLTKRHADVAQLQFELDEVNQGLQMLHHRPVSESMADAQHKLMMSDHGYDELLEDDEVLDFINKWAAGAAEGINGRDLVNNHPGAAKAFVQLDKDMMFYRGVNSNAQYNPRGVNKTLSLSTDFDTAASFGGRVYQVIVPKGSRVAFVPPHNGQFKGMTHGHVEFEVVIHPDAGEAIELQLAKVEGPQGSVTEVGLAYYRKPFTAEAPEMPMRAQLGHMVEGSEAIVKSANEVEQFNPVNLDFSKSEEEFFADIEANFITELDEASRGVITHQATREMADMLQMTVEEFENLRPLKAEEMLAAREIMVTSVKNLKKMAQKMANGNASDVDQLEFAQMMDATAGIVSKLKGLQTETARTQNAMKIVAGETENAAAFLEELYKGNLKKIAKKLNTLENDDQALNFIHNMSRPGAKEMFFEFWINALLSGIRTQVVNITSNAAFAAAAPIERTMAAAYAKMTGEDVAILEGFYMLKGMIRGIGEGASIAGRTFKEGAPVADSISRYGARAELPEMRAITSENLGMDPSSPIGMLTDWIGTGIRLPGRALMTMDEFFKAVNYRGELYALAEREAVRMKGQGASEAEILARTAEIREGGDMQMMKEASLFAETQTFTKELGSSGQALQHFINITPMAKIFVPFFRTPTNIIKETLKRTPLGLARMTRAGWKEGTSNAKILAEASMGSGIMMLGASAAMDGNITGPGPSDPRKRAQLRTTGWQPYSLVFNKGDISEEYRNQLISMGIASTTEDKLYVSYHRIEPIGTWLAISAHAFDTMKYTIDEKDGGAIAAEATIGIVRSLADKTFLTGVEKLSAIWSNQITPEDALREMFGSLVPTIVKDVSRLSDPHLKHVNFDDPELTYGENLAIQFMNEIRSRLPGLSKDVPNRINYWGDDIKQGQGNWQEIALPFYVSHGKGDVLDDVIMELGFPLSQPRPRIEFKGAQVDLNIKQWQRYMRYFAKTARQQGDSLTFLNLREKMKREVRSPSFKALPPEAKKDHLRAIQRKYRDAAIYDLVTLDPDLTRKVERGMMLNQMGMPQ